MLMIMGDLNARAGNDAATWHGIVGRFGPEEQNENGVHLLDFCVLNGLVVTNTLFQHRPCHQHTWFHPAESSRTSHILDYVIVNQQFRSSILDTRVYRKTHLESDHRLLVSKLRLKLKARRRKAQRYPRYQVDASYLEDQQVLEFRTKLSEGLAAGPKGDVEEAWDTFKESLKSAQSCLPIVSEKVEEDWVTDEVCEVARKKQEAWMRWMKFPDDETLRQEYQQLKRQSRQSADKAREEWWESKAEQAEKLHEYAVRLGHGGSLLKDLRLLQRSQKLKADTTLLAKDGKQLSSTGSKLERWREYFAQVNNISTQLVDSVVEAVLETAPEIPQMPGGDDSLSCVPSVDEIRAALQSLKNGRAPGEDDITSELLKLGGEAVVQSLAHLASLVWDSESVPEDWLRQLTVPLHKKGSTQDCDNYRGIALLSVPGKVFCRVIQRRLAERAEHLLRESQCGFRKGQGCIDQVFALRVLSEKAREFNTPLYLSFVDLQKAYDLVNREALWMVLQRKYHLPNKLIHFLRALHLGTKGAERAYGRVSGEFGITTGVRQGDVLAPTLFNLFFDSVIAATLAQHPHCGVRVLYNLGDELGEPEENERQCPDPGPGVC